MKHDEAVKMLHTASTDSKNLRIKKQHEMESRTASRTENITGTYQSIMKGDRQVSTNNAKRQYNSQISTNNARSVIFLQWKYHDST